MLESMNRKMSAMTPRYFFVPIPPATLSALLATVFNRGFWDGYYQGQKLGEWCEVYGSKATERKEYVGKCVKYFSNIGVAEFLIENIDLSVGDKVLVTGPTTGALIQTVDEIRFDLQPVETATRGQHISFKVNEISTK